MPEPLAPELKKRTVRIADLVPDPNNPRFTTREEDRFREKEFQNTDVMTNTLKKLESYEIDELVSSIKENGWLPVDYIFVRKLKGEKSKYVVLEGNRRLAALLRIKNEANKPKNNSLDSIDVMEVLDKGSTEELQRKISYLLGVRHHGSLKQWTPFAQAHNILKRYLEVSGQSGNSFVWNDTFGGEVAGALSIPPKQVKERLRVYRAMTQIGHSDKVASSKDGMQGRYYSVVAEPLLSPRKHLGRYIVQDSETFLLDEQSIERMINLCQFDVANRGGSEAPISNPQEWRYLERILADEPQDKRDANLKKVEEDKKHPSDVWAERAVELYTYTWDKWLVEVNAILKKVTLGELDDESLIINAKPTVAQLMEIMEELDRRDVLQEGVENG